MKKYQSRFGIVECGRITGFNLAAKTLTVESETITPSDSFWSHFAPQRVTIIAAPVAEEQQPDTRGAKSLMIET